MIRHEGRSGRRPARSWLAYAAALVAAPILMVSACGTSSGGSAATTTGAAASSIVVLTPTAPLGYARDGGNTGDMASTTILVNTHATLVENPYKSVESCSCLEQDWNNFKGVLAKSWDVSADGRTITFHLREGLLSQAGNELTSADVLWSFERHFNTPTANTKSVFAPYVTDLASQLTAPDKYTVAFVLRNAGDKVTVLSLLSNLDAQVYDSTALKPHVTSDDPYAVTWSKTGTGWGFGAYQITSASQTDTILTANPHYALGKPKVKTIDFKVVADPAAKINAVRSGDAEIAMSVLPSNIRDASSDPNVKAFTGVQTNMHLKMPLVTSHAPFDNLAVRRAMAYAVPYQQIMDNVYFGTAERMSSILRSGTEGYDGTGLGEIPYDPAKARQILRDAGIQGDVKFNLTVSSGVPDAVNAAVLIKSFAKDAGFDITINQIAIADFRAGRSSGQFQAFLDRDQAVVVSPAYQIRLWTAPGTRFNLAQWHSDDLDAAVNAALAQPDSLSTAAGKDWNRAEQVIRQQMPIVFIAWVAPDYVWSSKISGMATRSDAAIDFSVLSATA